MLSEETYRANYFQVEIDGRYSIYKAHSTNACKTDALIREYHELDYHDGGDEEWMFRRMHSIERELNRRGVKLE